MLQSTDLMPAQNSRTAFLQAWGVMLVILQDSLSCCHFPWTCSKVMSGLAWMLSALFSLS